MLHSIWKSAASCSIASSLIESSSPRSSATSWSPVVSPIRPSRQFQRHRRSKTFTIDMQSGQLSHGMKSKRSSRRTDISYSSTNVSSRQEAIRRMPGQTKEPMSPLKIVQVNSLVKPFALLSANAMDCWILRSLIFRLLKKSSSRFSEIWEHRLKGMIPFISSWTTAKSILSMTKWKS